MEALLHFVWEFRLCGTVLECSSGGGEVTVIDPGRHNFDSGPDFFNAKVLIDGHLWAGDVEIHSRASDWSRHGHDGDPAFNSVILHVVGNDDVAVCRSDGRPIPQVVVNCDGELLRDYTSMIDTSSGVLPCRQHIPSIPSIHLNSWIDALGFERLLAKSERLTALVDDYAGDWEQAVFITLARGLGFGVNSEPMMRLARATPLHFLRKHADNDLALEAILLGQSGLLERADEGCSYAARLRREYDFYQVKFGLSPLSGGGWKMSRMRPVGHPERRVAQLAAMVRGGFRLVARILECGQRPGDVASLFDVELSPYWQSHYNLGPEHGDDERAVLPSLGLQALNSLAINVAAPLLMAYGERHNDHKLTDGAVALLESLPAESNSVVKRFTGAGIKCRDAFTSQALIHLSREYCAGRKCLRCRIGHRILSSQRCIRSTVVGLE